LELFELGCGRFRVCCVGRDGLRDDGGGFDDAVAAFCLNEASNEENSLIVNLIGKLFECRGLYRLANDCGMTSEAEAVL